MAVTPKGEGFLGVVDIFTGMIPQGDTSGLANGKLYTCVAYFRLIF